jgi:hypothetical protein
MNSSIVAIVFTVAATAFANGQRAETKRATSPMYANGRDLMRPADYREWTFVSAGLGMDYQPPAMPAADPRFGNVFVTPVSYREFLATGRWPDRTVFVLEFRASKSKDSINKAGRFQGDLAGLEAEVKDARLPDGWAFYDFGRADSIQGKASPLPPSAGCMECHTRHTAVEKTFVQFYPTLIDAARRAGTLRPGF